jgi:hypothetical protein
MTLSPKEKSSSKIELSLYPLEFDIKTRVKRKKWAWTKTNIRRGNDLVKIFNDMKQWWPAVD